MSCICLDQEQHKSCQLLALYRVCSYTRNRWMTGWIIFLVAWGLHCFSKLIITAGRANRRTKMKHYPNFPHGSPLIYYFTGYFLWLGWEQVQLIICARVPCVAHFCSKFYFRVIVNDSTVFAEHVERIRIELWLRLSSRRFTSAL